MNEELIRDRVIGAMLGLATGDALGAPVEFNRRGEFPYVTDMQSGGYFRLPLGAWTDDTAMALCLADSLIHNPELDLEDLMDRFIRWVDCAENTSTRTLGWRCHAITGRVVDLEYDLLRDCPSKQ